ncbi:MAG TPA: hypothetical protein PLX66_03440 [Bacilli bacterium]|nr:hypothetical protein [Bacilli bacterium]
MTYLLDYDFNEEEISEFKAINNSFIVEKIEEYQDLIKKNMKFLKDLGVANYKEIFKRHAEMFLMDDDAFANVFDKYDRDDLVTKLKNNPDLVEQL